MPPVSYKPKQYKPKQYKGPIGPLRHCCAHCSATAVPLLRCTGCNAVRYCNREHQALHRAAHKADCNQVKKEPYILDKEEQLLRLDLDGDDIPVDPFEEDVGMFWALPETRDYMRTRYALANHLCMMGTLDGTKEAFDHFQNLMRLNRRDNMGLRTMMPALMLRLDLDLQCIQFITIWAFRLKDDDVDTDEFDGMEVPPDFVLADLPWLDNHVVLTDLVVLWILKLKLLVDLRNLRNLDCVLAARRLPMELRLMIRPLVVRSPLAAHLFLEAAPDALDTMEQKLLEQAAQLGKFTARRSHWFITLLFQPDEALAAKTTVWTPDSPEEAALALRQTYAAWWEMEGVLPWLADARRIARVKAERDLQRELDKISRLSHTPMPPKLAPEEMDKVCDHVDHVWMHLAQAYENASLRPRRRQK